MDRRDFLRETAKTGVAALLTVALGPAIVDYAQAQEKSTAPQFTDAETWLLDTGTRQLGSDLASLVDR
ncbi:Tat (twin-arginine translocation) pathway signal sequence [Evansella caseinilytica]|uniref:Tat (Twin-arginine translocation) pathway signal sequence n=1 Tax=Evansella caseinilytica TaxID=1503961 RepID=A0A1H3HFT0_9BACI|nr:twin-arginine translocation signal domain-containing protein [Evansella caseinilytica]SDY14331.1 Tat (twin-arginine translocation) pathway signal sequence [Evansella caseinilytica]